MNNRLVLSVACCGIVACGQASESQAPGGEVMDAAADVVEAGGAGGAPEASADVVDAAADGASDAASEQMPGSANPDGCPSSSPDTFGSCLTPELECAYDAVPFGDLDQDVYCRCEQLQPGPYWRCYSTTSGHLMCPRKPKPEPCTYYGAQQSCLTDNAHCYCADDGEWDCWA